MYFEQVKEYYTVFPKDQIKIIVYEDWTKNIQNEITNIFNFLNIKTNDEIENNQVNSNKIKPLKKVILLNFLRQNKIKGMIKKVLNQDRVDILKSYVKPEQFEKMILAGRRATWPQIERIRNTTQISRTLDHCLQRMSERFVYVER